MTTALEGGEGSASRPGRSLPTGKTWYPLYGRMGGPQGRSGPVRKISPPPGFDPRTVQPVASRYTDNSTGSLKEEVVVHPCPGTEPLYRPYGPQGGRGIALPFHDHCIRRVWGISVTPRPLFTPGKDPVPIVQEAGWAPGPVWTGAENFAPHRDSIPGPSSP
jgi:hypothetical protein